MTDITIKGASGAIVTLQGGTDAGVTNKAVHIQQTLNAAIDSGKAQAFDFVSDQPSYNESDKINIGVISTPGGFGPTGYQYVIVADTDDASTTKNDILLSTQQNSNNNIYINVLSGRRSGLGYLAGNESGEITNTTGNLNFDADKKTGNWDIITGAGNHTIRTGTGNNTISVGAGTSYIYSEGQDNINVTGQIYPNDPYTVAQITLAGGNSTVLAGKGGMVTDISSNNKITAYENTTVTAGTSGLINFWAAFDYPGNNTVQGGIGNTINSTDTNVTAIHGTDNTFEEVTENLTFFNGDGNTNATISKQFIGFGANGLNFTLNFDLFDRTYDPDNEYNQAFTGSSLFVADQGNETLNASGYNNTIQIYADTVAGAQTNFVATGGAGDDVLAAGTGNSTFTGGAGNNLFMFTKEVISHGTTVITDFANQGSNNLIGLYDYGLNSDNITQLLSNSHNDDKGNAILNLENHQITIQGVSVADLKASQFVA